jgi:hypothetical protein
MIGAIPPLPHYVFMAWYSVKTQGRFYLLYLVYNAILCLVKENYILSVSCKQKSECADIMKIILSRARQLSHAHSE